MTISPAFTASGLSSGLNDSAIIQAMVAAESAPITALAVQRLAKVTEEENEKYIKLNYPNLTKGKSRPLNYNHAGYSAGVRAGDNVSLRGRALSKGASGALGAGR